MTPSGPVLLLVSVLAITPEAAHGDQPNRVDAASGLIVAPGWELVNAHCGGCHSHRLVTSQRGDATFWRTTIRWMQRTQNLWDIPPEQETQIVSYLQSNYNESDWGRRPPLAESLLPAPD